MAYNWPALGSVEVLWRAVKIALVVGSVLNLINQGDVLLGTGEWSLPHLLLNYLVPFAVSTYSGLQTRASGQGRNT